jgi:hypothetical protein
MGLEEFSPCAILSSPAFSQPSSPWGCPLRQRLPRKTAIAYRAVTGAIQAIAISRLSTSVGRQHRALALCAASIRGMRSHASSAPDTDSGIDAAKAQVGRQHLIAGRALGVWRGDDQGRTRQRCRALMPSRRATDSGAPTPRRPAPPAIGWRATGVMASKIRADGRSTRRSRPAEPTKGFSSTRLPEVATIRPQPRYCGARCRGQSARAWPPGAAGLPSGLAAPGTGEAQIFKVRRCVRIGLTNMRVRLRW